MLLFGVSSSTEISVNWKWFGGSYCIVDFITAECLKCKLNLLIFLSSPQTSVTLLPAGHVRSEFKQDTLGKAAS